MKNLKKQAENKLQNVGAKLGNKVRSVVKSYKAAQARGDAAYAASPRGKKWKADYKVGGRP